MASDPSQFRVRPNAGNMPILTSPSVQVPVVEQMAQLGQGIQRAGAQASEIVTREANKANEAFVNEQLTKLKQRQIDLTYGEDGYVRKRGKNALVDDQGRGLQQTYGDPLDSYADELGNELTNETQRRAFNEARQKISRGFREGLDRHTDTEFYEYQKSTHLGAISVASEGIIAAGSDTDAIDENIALIEGQNGALGRLMGLDPDEVALRMNTDITKALAPSVSDMIDKGDTSQAAMVMDKYGDRLLPEVYKKLDAVLRDQQRYQVATETAVELVTQVRAGNSVTAPQKLILPAAQGTFSIGAPFGQQRGDRTHGGADMPMPTGTDVLAAHGGTVRIKQNPGGYGTYISIVSDDGTLETRYAHLSGTKVKDGDRVEQKQSIASSGGAKGAPGAGNSSGPHLHYEVRVNGKPVDPMGEHSTSASGPKGSLVDVFDAIDKKYANDPRTAEMAKQQARERWSLLEAEEKNNEQEATERLFEWQYNNPGRRPPPSLLAGVPGTVLPTAENFRKSQLENGGNTTSDETTSLRNYGILSEKIAKGEITSVPQLFQVTQSAGLTESHLKQLTDDVVGAQKGNNIDSMKSVNSAMSMFKAEITAVLDPKKDVDEYNQLRGVLRERLNASEQAKGRPLTGDEMRPIVLSLIGESAQQPVFGTRYNFQDPAYAIGYASIPKAEREQIATALRNKGVPPTPINILNTYRQFATGGGNQ